MVNFFLLKKTVFIFLIVKNSHYNLQYVIAFQMHLKFHYLEIFDINLLIYFLSNPFFVSVYTCTHIYTHMFFYGFFLIKIEPCSSAVIVFCFFLINGVKYLP